MEQQPSFEQQPTPSAKGFEEKSAASLEPVKEHAPSPRVDSFKLPVPRPLEPDFRRNRLMALATSPRKLLNYLKFKGRKKTIVVNYLPVQLDIEPVSRCNFHCTMCQVSDWPKYQRAADMPYDEFKKIIDSQYGLLEVKLQGYGEPTLAKNTFFDMIAYARKRHIWVRTTTNASLLHLHDNYKKLIDSGINEVQISIDGATKETFEKIRRGGKFERVLENCQMVNAYSAEKNVLRTRMWTTLQADNAHEFFQFLDVAKVMGFKRMTYSLNLHGFGQEKWIGSNKEINAIGDVTEEMANEAIERGKKLGIEVTFWRATDKYSVESVDTLCAWPFERVFISSDLRIVPCCVISNPDTADLGDAKDFMNQWNGPVFQEYRAAHLEGRIPNYCKECYEHNGEKKSSLNIVE